MPLVINNLESSILAALESAATTDINKDPVKTRKKLALDLATAIDAYIKSGSINIPTLAVATPSGAGTTTPITISMV